MRDEEMLAEIEDFIEGFNQPTYRDMRINGQRVATWSSQHGWSDDGRPEARVASIILCKRVVNSRRNGREGRWCMSWPIVITLAAVGSAAVVALLSLWWWVPKWQMRSITAADPKARADIEDNFRKTIGQLLGGAAVLIGAGFAYAQFTQQQRASHELLISNQVAKGFEQLGSGKLVVRLGGIYALEGVMNTSEQYHQPVLEALSAFVRDGTRTETGDGPPTTDIQAALTVIGRRAAIGTGVPNLVNAHSGAYLMEANLIDAYLSSPYPRSADDRLDANLSGASLRGAYLNGATVYQTQLDKACGIDVKLDPGLTLKPCQ
jgi:hypothetical protein